MKTRDANYKCTSFIKNSADTLRMLLASICTAATPAGFVQVTRHQGNICYIYIYIYIMYVLSRWSEEGCYLPFVSKMTKIHPSCEPAIKAGQYIRYCHVAVIRDCMLSSFFGCYYVVMWHKCCLFLVFKAAFTLKWCHLLNSPGWPTCSGACLYPFRHYIHIIYHSLYIGNLLGFIFCSSTGSHTNNIVATLIALKGLFGQKHCED